MYKNSIYNILIPLCGGSDVLLYNTMSLAFAVLNPTDWMFLDNLDQGLVEKSKEAEILLDRLILNGFVVPEDIDELARVEKTYFAMRNDESSLILTIAPTLACNFACDYCFQGSDKPNGMMSDAVMDATVAYVGTQIERIKSFHVCWYGGEPLLGLPVIEKLSKRFIELCDANQVAFNASIITNGYRLVKSVAETLKQCRVNTIQITLDGNQDYHDSRRHLHSKHGTFDAIIENITSWINIHPFAINLRVNIDNRNKDGIFALIDHLDASGLGGKTVNMYFAPVEGTTFGCSHIAEQTLGKSEFSELETSLCLYAHEKKLAIFPFPPRFMGLCGAMRPKSLVITPSGDLHKCWDTVTYSHQRVGRIDDIAGLNSNPINALWNNWSPFQNTSCRNCKILPSCAGACAYKFIHSDETRGEAAVLPCPSWKFSIKEKLLHTARLKGFITQEQMPIGTVTNPEELCTFAFIQGNEVPELPEKISVAKRESYAKASSRVKVRSPIL